MNETYLKDLLYLKGLSTNLHKVLTVLYKNVNPVTNKLILNRSLKKIMAKEINFNIATIEKAITNFIKAEILFREDKGMYIFNPAFFDVENIKDENFTVHYSVTYSKDERCFFVNQATLDKNKLLEADNNHLLSSNKNDTLHESDITKQEKVKTIESNNNSRLESESTASTENIYKAATQKDTPILERGNASQLDKKSTIELDNTDTIISENSSSNKTELGNTDTLKTDKNNALELDKKDVMLLESNNTSVVDKANNKGKTTPLSNEKKQEIITLHVKEKLSFNKISQQVGVSRSSVGRVCNNYDAGKLPEIIIET